VPEGDTVHKLANALRPLLEGNPLVSLWLRDRGAVAALAGAVVEEVSALGKHFLFALGPRDVLHVHLGMHGKWFRDRPGERNPLADRAAVVRLETDEHRLTCAAAPVAELLRRADLAGHPVVGRLGPDLLAPGFDAARAVARARGSDARTIADLLLDQRVACGLGNVYKSELLFLGGIDPWTPPARIGDAELAALYERARGLMLGNLGGWPRTTVRPVRAGEPWPAGLPRVFVYGRSGEPCLRCGAPIASRRQGDAARTTYWCRSCQPAGAPLSAASSTAFPPAHRGAR
jgi:endonuclease-8